MKHKIYAKVKLNKNVSCNVYESYLARYPRISISVNQGVRLIVPHRLPNKDKFILKILREKLSWIEKQLTHQKNAQKNSSFLNQKLTPHFQKIAREKIIRRTKEMAQNYGFRFNKIYLRTQKTRWGSASSKKNLSFNLRLAQLPQNVMDYVILHELTHLAHPNHSKKFWQALDKICPFSENYKKYLKNLRI